MTLADLKRLSIGTPVTLVDCLMGPCRKLRVLTKVQSNALVFTTENGKPSWLTLPKAKNLIETSDGFKIMADENDVIPGDQVGEKVAARYVWGHIDTDGFVHMTNIMGTPKA